MGHLHQDKKILNRVKRLQGQMRAIEDSIQDDQQDCIDVLQQVAAIKGAVNGLMNELIEMHLRHHVIPEQALLDEAALQEFLKLIKRYN
ncbi:metal/formaldehyde-sensitive transcriptional repressor [Acinetobacter pullicarnis]|uniref:metal/formaldehyde-sensitive transcriptional repressor n=1 Tax=Acinetobacter pullicarnis TaxID=2576829 RepID=UPI00111DAD89|nr:metal/formaldehyde-sensitive transcriptional repressor [Acinetobacter pullicarnis]